MRNVVHQHMLRGLRRTIALHVPAGEERTRSLRTLDRLEEALAHREAVELEGPPPHTDADAPPEELEPEAPPPPPPRFFGGIGGARTPDARWGQCPECNIRHGPWTPCYGGWDPDWWGNGPDDF